MICVSKTKSTWRKYDWIFIIFMNWEHSLVHACDRNQSRHTRQLEHNRRATVFFFFSFIALISVSVFIPLVSFRLFIFHSIKIRFAFTCEFVRFSIERPTAQFHFIFACRFWFFVSISMFSSRHVSHTHWAIRSCDSCHTAKRQRTALKL